MTTIYRSQVYLGFVCEQYEIPDVDDSISMWLKFSSSLQSLCHSEVQYKWPQSFAIPSYSVIACTFTVFSSEFTALRLIMAWCSSRIFSIYFIQRFLSIGVVALMHSSLVKWRGLSILSNCCCNTSFCRQFLPRNGQRNRRSLEKTIFKSRNTLTPYVG